MTREVIHAASFEGQVEQEFSIGKVLLVSDWAQLQAVDAGGAFTLLVADWYDAPELVDMHRF
ncbi:MAG: AAA family ATPase, partial [Bifidobacteriaceae bacterium]|nr:AAA family ATPase [Bifidobacteriaceae bacterium]